MSGGNSLLFCASPSYHLRLVGGWYLDVISKVMFRRIPRCCGVTAAFLSFCTCEMGEYGLTTKALVRPSLSTLLTRKRVAIF